LKEDGHSVVWLAAKMDCDRRKLYRTFDNYYIDTEMLLDISRILNYDFFADYSTYLADKQTTDR
jgi:hypothetical protein